ncbi:MAG: metallophosphoesterase [Clostridia bacterium]|nr:metallophosphoesterase [Clostridia bacterium]
MLFPGNSDYRGRHAGAYVPRPSPMRHVVRIAVVLLMLGLLAWPFVEPLFPEVEEVTLQPADFPEDISQLRVVYVSDIHAGPFFSQARVEDLVRRINRLNADIVLLGGDYAQDSASAVEFFRSLPAIHANYGVYAVTGNHDRTVPESNLALLREAMLQAGVTPLINEVASVRIGNASIWLAGVDDLSCGHPDVAGVASQVRKEDYVIFLCHSPAVIPDAVEARDANFQYGWFDLGLFGHTHGGQVDLFGGIVRDDSVPEAYREGWSRTSRADLLTSRGYGVSVLPIRLLCRPQIHLITLRSSN